MENSVRQCLGRGIWPRMNLAFRSRTCAWIRPINIRCDKESRSYASACLSGHEQESSLGSQTSWLSQQKVRMFSTLRGPFSRSSAYSKRSSDGVYGFASTRSLASQATAEDSEAYRSALPFEKVPKVGGLCAIPFIGLRFLFKPFSKYSTEGIGHVISELHDTHGPIFRLRMGNEWWIFTENLDDTDIALRSEKEFPYRAPITLIEVYNKRAKKPLVTLGTLNGPEWKRLRSPMNVRMNRPNSVTHYLPSQEDVAVDFAHRLHHLQDAPPEILVDLFFSFATESVGVVCYNKRLGFLADDFESDSREQKLLASYVNNVRCVSEDLLKKRFMFRFYEDSFYKRYKDSYETSFEYTTECLQDAAAEVAWREREGTFDPEEPNFLLSLMSEKSLDEDDVAGIIYAVMTAGSDSTACGLQLLFYALATNKDKQEKVAEELLTHMGHDGHLTATVLDKLVYLKAAVKESMRLYYPIPWGPTRRLPFGVVLSGYRIPKGITVGASSLRVSLSPKHYDQPHSFIPERWLRDQKGQRQRDISTLAYLPFGYGVRNCIGRRFALQEIYLATAKVLQNYQIGLKDNHPKLETIFTPFRSPQLPMLYTLTPRR